MRQEHIVILILVVIYIVVGKWGRWEGRRRSVSVCRRMRKLPHRVSTIYRLQQTGPDYAENRCTMACVCQRLGQIVTLVREMKTKDEIREKEDVNDHPAISLLAALSYTHSTFEMKQRRYVQSSENEEKEGETIAVNKREKDTSKNR